MKVLIVGGAGKIGRYPAKEFSRQGDGVKVLDRLEMSRRWNRTVRSGISREI